MGCFFWLVFDVFIGLVLFECDCFKIHLLKVIDFLGNVLKRLLIWVNYLLTIDKDLWVFGKCYVVIICISKWGF